MKYLRKVFLKYEHRGIGYIAHYFLKKIGFKTKFSSFLHKKKFYLDNLVYDLTKGVVKNGIYKNLKLSKQQNWKSSIDTDLSPKLLGIYEEQVQKKIIKLKEDHGLEYLVNFGAGEGYHAIGLVKNNIFKSCLCFEMDTNTKNILEKNINLNEVDQKIKVYNEANFDEVINNIDEKKLEKTLFLVDVEGYEFQLYIKENLNFIKKSFHLIENHEDYIRDKKSISEFFEFMNGNFESEILHNTSRNPYTIDELKFLPDDERWLMMSEGRPCEMNWLIFKPCKN